MADIKKIAEELVSLSIKEAAELANILKEEYGIEPAVAQIVTGGGSSSEVEEEKTNFNVIMKSAGASKLAVVKEVKTLTGLGLKEAKELVDSAPATIKENMPKIEAESIKQALEAVGATIELT